MQPVVPLDGGLGQEIYRHVADALAGEFELIRLSQSNSLPTH